MPALLIIFDGLGDLDRTPLQMAKKKYIDKLANEGALGILHPLGRGIKPGSDTSHLEIFGYDYKEYYPKRGPLEALGANIKLNGNDIAARANFATKKGDIIIDRRAGRIETSYAKILEKKIKVLNVDGYNIEFYSTTEHRGVVVIRDYNREVSISGNDPHKNGLPFRTFKAINKESEPFADLMNKYVDKVHEILKQEKANYLLLRGFGRFRTITPFSERFGLKACIIAGAALYKGVAKYVGIDVINVEGATGDKHSNYMNKFKEAIKRSKDYDLVIVHLKATDSFGHDGDCKGKTAMIEKADEAMRYYDIKKYFSTIVITGDHSTPCKLKGHSGHGVPFLAYGNLVRKDKITAFDEYSCMEGGLGHITAKDILKMIINWENKNEKIGS